MVVGATAVLRHAKKGNSALKLWAQRLLAKKPFKVVAVALANKTARIIWALLRRGGGLSHAGHAGRLTPRRLPLHPGGSAPLASIHVTEVFGIGARK